MKQAFIIRRITTSRVPMKQLLGFLVVIVFAMPATAQWTRVDGIPAGESYAVISSGDTVYASVDSVVYISEDGGTAWQGTEPIRGLEAPITALLKLPSGLVAGTLANGVFETTDGGLWTNRTAGLAGLGANSISALVVRDTMVYAGTVGAGVFRTGRSFASPWSQFSDGIPSNLGWNIGSLTNLNDTLWAGGGSNAIVYRNTSPARSWEDIVFARFSPMGTAFLAATSDRGSIHAIGSQGLHRSTDGGATWTEFDPGAGFIETGGFVRTPARLHAFLGKVGATYLFKLGDDDSSWTQVDVEPGPTFAMTLAGNFLFAAKFDGLWKYELTPSTADGDAPDILPAALLLHQNYPNPFNPTTVIRYRVSATSEASGAAATPTDGRVRLAVYDVLGKEVEVLVDEQQQPGSYQITFNGSHLSAGTYLYRLSSGSRAESRRMLLIK